MNSVKILTTQLVEGAQVVDYKGLVTARNVRGVNLVRDFFTSFRDIFGGRSNSYEQIMQEMEIELCHEISSAAAQLGANAIVGFTLDFDNVGSKGKSLLMAYAKGTAVVLQS